MRSSVVPPARRAFLNGAQPDRWNRWCVERVVEVRRMGGNEARLEARVRWKSPAGQLPWPDTWEALADSKGGAALAVTLLREAEVLERAKYGSAPISGALLDKSVAPPKRRRSDTARAVGRGRPVIAGGQRWERRWSALRGRTGEIRKRTRVQVVVDEEDTLIPGSAGRRRITDDGE